MGKVSFLIGLGAGYVVGTRAGRERYEQIRLQARRAWQSPALQHQVAEAKQQIRERGPEVAAAVGQAALRGAGTTARNAALAGFAAATGKRHGPVLQGEISKEARLREDNVAPRG